MSPGQYFDLFVHFFTLSMLAVGGALTTTSAMYHFLVDERGWLDSMSFTAAIITAQVAPGPNVMFVTLLGWQAAAGLGAANGQWWAGPLGMTIALLGTMLPSSTVTLLSLRWIHQHRHRWGVRALRAGLAPISLALLLCTAFTLLQGATANVAWGLRKTLLIATFALCLWLVVRGKLHLLLVLLIGAAVGVGSATLGL